MNINLTLIGQMIAFAIFIWFCKRFVWTALMGMMEARAQKIADGLEAADRASRDLELAQEKATDQLHEAKQQAASIIDQANKRATQIIEEAKAQAIVEGDRLKAAAEAEVQQQINRAREELRGKVASLVLQGAEKVLEANIDPAANRELVDKLAAQL